MSNIEGLPPDFVIMGGPDEKTNGVILLASNKVNNVKVNTNSSVLSFEVKMKEKEALLYIVASDYPTAFNNLFEAWKSEQKVLTDG